MTSGILTRSRSIWTNNYHFSVFQKFLLPGKGLCPLPGITILFSSPAKRRGSRPFWICGTIHTLRLVFSRRLCPLFGDFYTLLGKKQVGVCLAGGSNGTLKGEKRVSVSQPGGENGTLRQKKRVSVSQPEEINGTLKGRKRVSVSQPGKENGTLRRKKRVSVSQP